MVEKMRVLVQQNVMQLGIGVRLVRQNDISAQHTYAKGGFDIRAVRPRTLMVRPV